MPESKHLCNDSASFEFDSDVINLGLGVPSPELLKHCAPIFKKATDHRMNFEEHTNSGMLFQYGPESGICGARMEIAKYFSTAYGDEVKSENVFLTSGATQGLHLCLSVLVDLKGYIFFDEFTYMYALDLVKKYSALNIVPVKLNPDGVDLLDFESALKEKKFNSSTKEYWGMYYTMPVYHNPTGIVFSPDVCKGLIKLARKYDILILCDDVYNILSYEGNRVPKRLFAYDDCKDNSYRGNVISNGSFSKILAPGARLGWIEGPERVLKALNTCAILQSSGALNNYTSGILASLFQLKLAQPHIHMMINTYKDRMKATIEVLTNELPKSCNFLPPKGGYFIWISLPDGCDAADFLKFCEKEKIIFIPGSKFSANESSKNFLRLTIAYLNQTLLVHGTKRICALMKEFLKEK